MNAFKYMMIDVRRAKGYVYSMFMFGAIAYFYAEARHDLVSGAIYLMFAATMMQGGVFNYDQKQDTGFVNLLPGTELERSAGRFLMGVFFLIIGVVMSGLVAIAATIRGNLEVGNVPEMLMAVVGAGLIFMAIQNVIFYAIGKGNSQQFMAIIHMIPGFVFLLALTILTSMVSVAEEYNEQMLVKMLLGIKNNTMILSVLALVLGIVFTIAGIFVSKKILSKKDFA